MIISDDNNKNNSPKRGDKIQKLPPKSKNLEAVSNEFDETYEKPSARKALMNISGNPH